MQEIEVKAKVADKKSILDKLEQIGCVLSEPVTQDDRVFIPVGQTIPVPNGVNVFRIRTQQGKFILTLKQPVTNQLDCIERELGIDNSDEMSEICKLLGFFESSRVVKTRQKAKYNDLEICLDTVEGLGDFIEVEKLVERGDAGMIQAELITFLESLGISKQDQVFDGYDILIKNKNVS